MDNNISFILFLAVLVRNKCHGNEPHCSKFHYEEKLLEKLVRMEFKSDQHLQSSASAIEKLKEEVAICRHEAAAIRKEIAELKESIIDQIKNETAILDQQYKAKGEKAQTPTILFRARNVNNKTPRQGETIVFTEVLSNHGSGYDKNTGVFTAPETGSYLFTVHFCPLEGKYVVYNIMVDGVIHTTDSHSDADRKVCTNSVALVYLSKDEKVWAESFYTGSQLREDGHRFSYFAGVLLHI